jgi:hypothetical protein
MNLSSNEVTTYVIAILFALLVHGVVIGLMSLNWDESTRSYSDLKPYYIEAAIVAENPYRAKEERAADQEKSRRDKKLRDRRKTEARLRQDQANWARQQRQIKTEVKPPEPAVIPEPTPVVEKTLETKVDPESVRSEFK